MKFATLVLIAMSLFLAIPAQAQLKPVPGDQRPADRDAIRNHIDKIFQAYIHKDAGVIRATHSSEWIGFQDSSRTEVHGIDDYMKQIDGYFKWSGHMSAYKMLEFDVLFYGDTALVPYVASVSYEDQGSTQTVKLRVLDVYAKLGGEWNQVGSDTGLHPETLEAQQSEATPISPDLRKSLLDAREAVWRDYFSNNHAHLEETIPTDLVAIDEGEQWHKRDDILNGAKDFVDKGGKLISLEFPTTEVQVYGRTAILYSKYSYEIEINGQKSAQSGRATEVFVFRNDKWVNTGWHLDSDK
ncbi:MAG: nuclear transport factor 2 family protein [Candidatus Acidiferrales bacterium]